VEKSGKSEREQVGAIHSNRERAKEHESAIENYIEQERASERVQASARKSERASARERMSRKRNRLCLTWLVCMCVYVCVPEEMSTMYVFGALMDKLIVRALMNKYVNNKIHNMSRVRRICCSLMHKSMIK